MRRCALIMMVAVVALLARPLTGDAETVTAGIGLNLRTGPSTGHAIITAMPYGSWVEVVAGPDDNGWMLVNYQGIQAYAHGNWIAGTTTTAAPQPPAPSGGHGGYSWITGGYYGGTVIDAIYYWSAYYGISADWMLRVARCESGFDPTAVGPNGEIGVFQFMSGTFYAYGGSNPWDPWDNARVAASMFSQGLSWHWVCQ